MSEDRMVDIVQVEAVLPQTNIDLLSCIGFFESGAQAVYLVDETSRYVWHAVPRKGLRLQPDAHGNIYRPIVSQPAVLFPQPVDAAHQAALSQAVSDAFEKNPEAEELPILQRDGKLIAVARWHQEDEKQAFSFHEEDLQRELVSLLQAMPQPIYLSSLQSPVLAAFAEAFDGKFHEIEIEPMDAKNLGSILSGTAPGTLLYDQDIYPAIQKIGIRELYRQAQRGLCYRQNHQALEAVMEVPDALKGEVPPEEKVEIPRESHVKEFLAQLESPNPVLLHDAYDVEELTWMCDRLRTSERFGADNHLYLRYSSIAVFQQTLAVDDWRPVITSGKSVFLFRKKKKKERYGKAPIANPHKPSHLEIDEINEIVNSIPRGYSGSCFFNMVLDGHPYLLTIGRHGLSAFSAIYKVFCEGEIVVDAIEHLKKPKNTNEEKLQQENLKTMLAGKSVDRLPEFFNKVTEYLEPEKKYGIDEWFKAFYLANNTILGREFLQRIAPAIFYDKHGGYEGRAMYWFGFSMKQLGDLNERCLNGF